MRLADEPVARITPASGVGLAPSHTRLEQSHEFCAQFLGRCAAIGKEMVG
jgi:hypothetical protein